MGSFRKSLGNWWTTIAGLLTGIGMYISKSGAKIPSTWDEAVNFLLGLGIVMMGVLAKDGKTGSSPK